MMKTLCHNFSVGCRIFFWQMRREFTRDEHYEISLLATLAFVGSLAGGSAKFIQLW